MARQGLLAQSTPAAATDTLLYSASVTESASAMLKIANDGTGAAYRVAVRDYDQELALDASTYKLHKGDVITSYRVQIDTAVAAGTFPAGTQFTSSDGEKKLKFESFYIPALTTIFVKEIEIRDFALESVTGTFNAGDTITKGTGGDTTTAVLFSDESGGFISIGPSTVNGSGTVFAEGDTVTSSSGGTGTIAVGGIGTASDKFVFSETTSGGTYLKTISDLFGDRAYKFDLSDSSMTGRNFLLSETENGIFGPDGLPASDPSDAGDAGVEYTTGKTSSGTPGSTGAFVQYDFSANSSLPSIFYWYDSGSATYGGPDSSFNISAAFTYNEFYVYDVEGTWVNSTDAFVYEQITYTVTAQTAGPYGTVADYTGTALKVILGTGSAEFAGTDTFDDVPKDNNADRTEATVSSVTTAKAAIAAGTFIANDVTNAANNVDTITSLVVGCGGRIHVRSATQNNTFTLIGFEDASSEYTTRVFGASY